MAHDAGVPKLPSTSDVSESASAAAGSITPVDERALSPGDASPMIRAVATVRFGPENSPAEVPVLAGPGITEEWLAQQPQAVSEHGEAMLASQGFQVEQQRQFIMTVLADGRRVAIPVDHVQIQYTGNEPL